MCARKARLYRVDEGMRMSDHWLRRAYGVLQRHLGDNLVYDRPLAKETTFRVGGPVSILASADTFGQLRIVFETIVDYDLPWFILGKGSNLLVSDGGFKGVAIRLGADFRKTEFSGIELRAGAGSLLSACVQGAVRHSLGGLAFAIGIPGTIGGAVAGNAGAFEGSVGEIIKSATVFTPGGGLKSLDREDMEFGYRASSLGTGEMAVLEVSMGLKPSDPELIKMDMERFFRTRKGSQPLHYPSAGSTFKNPPGGSAGRLIETAGCKGLAIGGAMVSEQHANFIVNAGGASATDIFHLIIEVRQRVEKATGVLLEPEVKLVGTFNEEFKELERS